LRKTGFYRKRLSLKTEFRLRQNLYSLKPEIRPRSSHARQVSPCPAGGSGATCTWGEKWSSAYQPCSTSKLLRPLRSAAFRQQKRQRENSPYPTIFTL